ncbi:MAG: hypothetical protein ACTSPY_10000 [Candidatus Helarchaeota archaeon]
MDDKLNINKFQCDREECNNFQCILHNFYNKLKDKDIIKETLGYASEKIYELALKNTNSLKRRKLVGEIEKILEEVGRSEFLFIERKGQVLITAPHAAWHYRYFWSKNKRKLGDWIKLDDINTGILACYLGRSLDLPILIQLYTAWLDPNFYREALLRKKLREILDSGRIKFVLDIHGLSNDRKADFDIIDMFGLALLPFSALNLRKTLKLKLEQHNFKVGVNRYFNGGLNIPFQHTIIKETTQEFQIPCIELEISKRLRTMPKILFNKTMLNVLKDWLKNDVIRFLESD